MARKGICVGAVLVREGRVLLGLRASGRAHFPGVWDLFGGHVCAGESSEEALVRELHEELGIKAGEWRLVAVADYAGAIESYEYRVYAVTDWQGTPQNRQREEHEEIRWFSRQDIEGLRLAHSAYGDLLQSLLGEPAGLRPGEGKRRD
jgi:8-oxo-dGTP diphosphatase